MFKYKCCECGQGFDEPCEYRELHEFWGAPCYEEFSESPCCGADYEDWTDDEYEDDDEDEGAEG